MCVLFRISRNLCSTDSAEVALNFSTPRLVCAVSGLLALLVLEPPRVAKPTRLFKQRLCGSGRSHVSSLTWRSRCVELHGGGLQRLSQGRYVSANVCGKSKQSLRESSSRNSCRRAEDRTVPSCIGGKVAGGTKPPCEPNPP